MLRSATTLAKHPVLAHFDENAETEMHMDACDIGLAAVLTKKQSTFKKVIGYTSRGLSQEEKNYSAYKKECLAISNMGHLEISALSVW